MFRGNSRRRAETAPAPSQHAAIHIGIIGTDYSGKTELLSNLLNHRHQPHVTQDYVLPTNEEMPAQSTLLVDIPCEPENDLMKWCDWSECFVLCFSVSDRDSYEEIIRLRESIRKAKRTRNIPTLLLGTSFGVRGRVVEYEEANKLAKQMNIHFTEVSRNPFHISEAVRIIVKLAIQFRAANPEERGTLRRGARPEENEGYNSTLRRRPKMRTEVSSFDKWDETLDQIAKRVTKNPQQFGNKAEVLRKFLEEEREYCEKLNCCLKIFLRPLQTADPPILKRKNLQKIFRNLEVIVGQTVTLVNAIYQRVFEEWQLGNETVGDLFEMLGAIIKLYETYLQNHISSMTCVNNMEKKNVTFADFLQRANGNVEAIVKGLDFVGFLLLPVEKLRKYERVVEALQTHTPENHPDFSILSTVVASIVAARTIIQSKMEENFQLVFSIQRSFVGDFVIAKEHSFFIYDGGLHKVCKSGERKLRWFFLFNDSLVYAAVIPAPTLPISSEPVSHNNKNVSSLSLQPYHGNVYAFSRKITLGIACKIVDMINSTAFKIISVEKTFVVYASTMNEKKKWLENFVTVLSEDSIVTDGRSESTYQLSAAARESVKIKQCMMCTALITAAKHYCCRNCGKVICAACSTKRYRISHFGDDSTVRVCDYCHHYLSNNAQEEEQKTSKVKFESDSNNNNAPPGDASKTEKPESLVGYSLKKMRHVGQFVKRKTQTLDLFKRKKPTQQAASVERPSNITIGRPVVNTNVVVLSNSITTQYNDELTAPHPTLSPPLKPVSVVPNRGVYLSNANTHTTHTQAQSAGDAFAHGAARSAVRNSISHEEAQHLEQNLKQKIAHLNLAIQKQQRENPGKASVLDSGAKFETSTKAPPNLNLPRPPTYNETTAQPEPTPPKAIPNRKPPGEQMLPMRISPPHSTSPPNVSYSSSTSPPKLKPAVSKNPPVGSYPPVSSNPPKHMPAPRRFGVKLDSFSNLDELAQQANAPPASTSPPSSQPPIPTSTTSKKKPDVPVKPLPARPPASSKPTTTPTQSSSSSTPISPTSSTTPNKTTVINPNSMMIWKCLPDEPISPPKVPTTTPSSSSASTSTGSSKTTHHAPPSRPPPPPPRNALSPTRERAETSPAPPPPPRDAAARTQAQDNSKNAAGAKNAAPVRPPRSGTQSHMTYPRRQGKVSEQ